MGCLEYRYNPFLIGSIGGEFAQFTITIPYQSIRIAQWEHPHKTLLSLILREEKWNRWQSDENDTLGRIEECLIGL